jgi:hypothetical protein
VGIQSTSTVRFLVGIDSAMYARYPFDHVTVADNVMFRVENMYSGWFGQSITEYTYLVSTSASTDTTLGMTGSSAGTVLSNWATKSAARSDTGSWDAAILQSSATEPTSGIDGKSYGGSSPRLGGRYMVVWNDYSGGHPTGSSNWYQYAGYLATHEIGHGFGSTHTNAYYTTTATTCSGVYYNPSPPAPLPPYFCIGASSNCQGVYEAGVCVGSSPPRVTAYHYYVMQTCGCNPQSPSSSPPNYWDGGFDATSQSYINGCLSNWHSISRTPGNYSC